MRHSGDLLLTTDHTVREIARKVGYDNALTFSKSFKALYGVSPKHYRTQPEADRLSPPELPVPARKTEEENRRNET